MKRGGKKGKAPAYQMYVRDYETDENVKMMDVEHEGCFIRLLNNQWMEGSVPADLESIARICRVTPQRMKRLWPKVAPCFKSLEPGRLYNVKLHEQRKERDAFTDAAKEAGRKGAEKRWGGHSDPNGVATDTLIGSDSSAVCRLPSVDPSIEGSVQKGGQRLAPIGDASSVIPFRQGDRNAS